MPLPHDFSTYPAGNFAAQDWMDNWNYTLAQTAGATNYVPPFTGGVTRTVTSKLSDVISILDFGAQPSGGFIPDSTAAIAAAIAAVPSGGALYIPSCPSGQAYVVTGSGSAIFTLPTPIKIYGDGFGSRLLVNNTVPNTRDVFHITGNSNGWEFSNFSILAGAGNARHALHFDIPLGNLLLDVKIDHLSISAMGGGNSIKLTNNVSTT